MTIPIRPPFTGETALAKVRAAEASINDVPIAESDRTYFWPASGPRPADHPGIPDVA